MPHLARDHGEAQPRILESWQIEQLLDVAEETRYPIRNKAIVLLSCEAGLTAGEIANLKRYHVLTDRGVLGTFIDLTGMKRRRIQARRIPIGFKTRIWWAIHDVLKNAPGVPADPLIISERAREGGGATRDPGSVDLKPMRATSIAYIFWKLFERAGIGDVPTNAGRNTFLVNLGREASKVGANLLEVKEIGGFRSIESTRRFLLYDEKKRDEVWGDLLTRMQVLDEPRKGRTRRPGGRSAAAPVIRTRRVAAGSSTSEAKPK